MPYMTAAKNVMLDALANGRSPALQITHVGVLRADAGKAVTGAASTDVFTSTAHGYSNGDLVVLADGGKSVTGTASTDVLSSTAHGYSNGDVVMLSGLTGGAGLSTTVRYYVIGASTDRFQLSLTAGGSAVDFTTDMSAGTVTRVSTLASGAGLVAGRGYYVIGSSTDRFQLALTSGGSAVDFTTDLSAGTVTRLVELSGGSPAYARQAIAFNAAGSGTVDDSTNGAVIDMPPSSTNDYLGHFSASTAGTLLAFNPPSVVETFAGQGTCTVRDADLDLLATP